jgi:macrolide transport system ATP-binding/permease protein
VVRKTLADIDPNLTILDMMSFANQVSLNFNQERFMARLTELLGLLALALACVGLYGVTAYTVARRTKEIGIRMALGSRRSSVLSLVMRGALVQSRTGSRHGDSGGLGGRPPACGGPLRREESRSDDS